jgi:sugar lactone lactonase YvrE
VVAIAVNSEKLRALVDDRAVVEQVATGFMFTEGPIWMPDDSLHFSDMPGDKRRRWHSAGRGTQVPGRLPDRDRRDGEAACRRLGTAERTVLLARRVAAYINDTGRAHIRVFDVGANHELSNGRVFAENIGDGDPTKGGLVDGMKADERGDIYVTGPVGVWVFAPDGEHLGVIGVPESVGNLNWGDDDWRTLYIAASTSIYRVRLNVRRNRLGYMG